ncbi:MAG: B12-binding domain-containing radical SAM protein [Acidobacteria bacterium]|nr:B12-binding domain-containing radical SAM protein [Acidobacteriota bacterium]
MNTGKRIVLTAPLTEMIDHAGYFIQMGMASMPVWMEFVFNKKYPGWKNVQRFNDGTARSAPAGLRVLEKVMEREFGGDNVAVCYPDDLEQFVGSETRVVAVSTHNPLGVTFAAGVYTSLFGSSSETINAHYAKLLFERLNNNPHRSNFKVIVGGSGGWQIKQTESAHRLGVDCIVDGRSESPETSELFHKVICGEPIPCHVDAGHPKDFRSILFPDKPTTFGVAEMTTGCGRRCQFCMPDLNPQIAIPKERIMSAVRANVENGNSQISLATEDMFIWGQVRTDMPFFFPNREALVDLYSDIVNYPGVKYHVLGHCTMAPALVDPELIRKLSQILLPKSPIRLPAVSSHSDKKALVPLIGLETGSVPMAKRVMPGKGVPFKIDDWPSVVIRGLEILNRNNWFPMLTLMVGNPGETDDDVRATLDLIFELERRHLFGFLVPSVFTPLEGTRMQHSRGVTCTRELSRLQWQLIMKCWKMNLRPGLYSRWGPAAFKLGGLALWSARLRKTNGPNFKWPMLMFSSVLPERWMYKMGKLYQGEPIEVKTRAELLASIRPTYWKYLREDCGNIPDAKSEANHLLHEVQNDRVTVGV